MPVLVITVTGTAVEYLTAVPNRNCLKRVSRDQLSVSPGRSRARQREVTVTVRLRLLSAPTPSLFNNGRLSGNHQSSGRALISIHPNGMTDEEM